MGDSRTERHVRRADRVDVDESVVTRHLGKTIDPPLVDLDPVRQPDLLPWATRPAKVVSLTFCSINELMYVITAG
jgi:hypothetical protein